MLNHYEIVHCRASERVFFENGELKKLDLELLGD